MYENGRRTAAVNLPFPVGEPIQIDYNAFIHQLEATTPERAGGACCRAPAILSLPLDLAATMGAPAPALPGFTAGTDPGDGKPIALQSWRTTAPVG